MPALIRLVSSLCICLVVQACQSVLRNYEVIDNPVQEKRRIGERLENKLLLNRDIKPIFSTRQHLDISELKVLIYFTETLPSGSLIFDGNPSYWFDIKKEKEPVRGAPSEIKRVTYTIQIIDAQSNKVVTKSTLFGDCIESEALYTYPTRCSLRIPPLLREALEAL